MKKQYIAFTITAVYITIMAIGMYVMHHVYGFNYTDNDMVRVIVWAELVMTALAIGGVVRYFSFRSTGFTRPDFSKLVWLLPHALLLAAMLALLGKEIISQPLAPAQWRLLALGCFMTVLVGFSEEVVFRGILLHYFSRNKSLLAGLVVSTLCFGTLHLVNYFGGSTISQAVTQFMMTMVIGLFFALIVIKTRSIIPIIFFHWLWDFSLIGLCGELSPLSTQLGLIGMPLSIIMIIALLINMRKELGMKVKDIQL